MGAILSPFSNVPQLRRFYIDAYGADPTGAAFSDTAMAAAMSALSTVPGTIVLTPGATYKMANSYTFGPAQGMTGSATLNYTGNSVFIHAYDASFNTSSLLPASPGGTFAGFIIDGTSAGASAKGFQLGDLIAPAVSITVQNFTGASAIGAWLCNTVGWTEYANVTIETANCTSHIVFDNAGGLQTFDASNWTFAVNAQPNQNAVTWQNSANQVTGTFTLYGGFKGGTSNSGKVLNVGPDSTGAGLKNVLCVIGVEADSGAGTVGPVAIALGGNGFLIGLTGQLYFASATANFQASTGLFTYRFTFAGYAAIQASGDPTGNPGTNGFAMNVTGGSLWCLGTTDATHIYNGTGDFFATVLGNGANTVALANLVAGKAQRILWRVTQPASGAAGTLTLTGVKTTSGSGALTLSSANGAVDFVDIWTPDGSTWYAAVQGTNFH